MKRKIEKNQAKSIIEDYKIATTKTELLLTIRESIQTKSKRKIYAVNAHIFCEGLINSDYLKIIKNASINICDGVNVKRLIKLTSGEKVELFPGPDLFKLLVQEKYFANLTHLFIGGTTEVNAALQNRFGNINKHYFSPPFVDDAKNFNFLYIRELIEKTTPDIIWVGLGAPKQERVIHELFPYISNGLLIGVGAAFNFHSGLKKYRRAPKSFRKLKLEWLFRLFQEPERIAKRQSRNLFYLFKGYLKYRI